MARGARPGCRDRAARCQATRSSAGKRECGRDDSWAGRCAIACPDSHRPVGPAFPCDTRREFRGVSDQPGPDGQLTGRRSTAWNTGPLPHASHSPKSAVGRNPYRPSAPACLAPQPTRSRESCTISWTPRVVTPLANEFGRISPTAQISKNFLAAEFCGRQWTGNDNDYPPPTALPQGIQRCRLPS